jgi:hypothetical protein
LINRYEKEVGGDEEGLDEPFVRLLMLVRAINEENVLEKECIEC